MLRLEADVDILGVQVTLCSTYVFRCFFLSDLLDNHEISLFCER